MEANKTRTTVELLDKPRMFFLMQIFHQRFCQGREILHLLVLLIGNFQSMLFDKLVKTEHRVLSKQMEGDSSK